MEYAYCTSGVGGRAWQPWPVDSSSSSALEFQLELSQQLHASPMARVRSPTQLAQTVRVECEPISSLQFSIVKVRQKLFRCVGNCNADDFDYQFEFEDKDDVLETFKKDIINEINQNCLEKAVRKVVPIDVIAIFENHHAEETLDKSAELRQEIISFIDILVDMQSFTKMYINFPKQNLMRLRRLLKPFHEEERETDVTERSVLLEVVSIEPRLSAILKPLFAEEAIFYEKLSEVLKG